MEFENQSERDYMKVALTYENDSQLRGLKLGETEIFRFGPVYI